MDIVWTIDGDEVGRGGVYVAVADADGGLDVGTHTLAATVTDPDGNQSTATLQLDVTP